MTTQSSKLEMIDSLFKLGADGKDEGMIRFFFLFFESNIEYLLKILICCCCIFT